MPDVPGPYTRIYWRFSDEYPEVFDDDKLFAWWMRLLIIADGAHPSSATFPRRISDRTIVQLENCGLLARVGGNHYRIKGVESERLRRKDERRNGGVVRAETGIRGPDGRWVATSTGTSGGIQQSSNRRDETRRDEQRKAISLVEYEKPFVTMTEEEKAAKRQRDQDELNLRMAAKVGVKP